MARTKRVLPGLSRSSACSKTKSCQRLDGHKGPHRASLHAAVTKSPVSRPVGDKVPASTKSTMTVIIDGKVFDLVPRKAPSTKSTITIEKGVEVLSADRYEVPTEAAKAPAKARRPKVRQLRHVAPKERVGVSGPVGQHRTARRAKAAPVGTKSRSNANALKGRV